MDFVFYERFFVTVSTPSEEAGTDSKRRERMGRELSGFFGPSRRVSDQSDFFFHFLETISKI